jgi:uncharacterized cupin superfamily protein
MSMQTMTHVDTAQISWPAPVPIASERVITGQPKASTLVLEETPAHQLGLWQVSPGEFVTDHAGYVEYIHIISGSGQLVDNIGHTIDLAPGTTVLMQPGWKGRWIVHETITKVFTVIKS